MTEKLGDADRKMKYTQRGEINKFLSNAILYPGNMCLIWPHGNNGHGYPVCYRDGKNVRAHRAVCEAVNGPCPDDRPEAAHSCGNGNIGCVTPRHLRWASRVENISDTMAMGRVPRGSKHHRTKLTEQDVLHIRSLKGLSARQIGLEFGIAKRSVCDILRGKRWGWLMDKTVQGDA